MQSALAAAQESRSHMWDWATLRVASQAILPMLPQANAGEYWFPIRLGLRRWRRGRSATGLKPDAEIRNEGAPFRCLGLHTHWKAPTEAQTRFSEDPAKPILQDGDQSSTARHYRQAKHDSQNLLNIATRVTRRQPFRARFSDQAPVSGCRHLSPASFRCRSSPAGPQLRRCCWVSKCN